MNKHEQYMLRCIELAQLGQGKVAPNPMVGCVIVYQDRIIGEGWHKQYGEHHAEVNAIHSVQDKTLLHESTAYVNLEPCSHFGKTPPCADLLIKHKLKKVVVGMVDPFDAVAGNGIRLLKEAGIEVELGVLQQDCEWLNKRFITYHTKQRPYIILKWAQTMDGFIAAKAHEPADIREQKRYITNEIVQVKVHKDRSEEDAILVGTNTVLLDNPQLNTRMFVGKNPLRIAIDKAGVFNPKSNLFDGSSPTLILTDTDIQHPKVEYCKIDFKQNIWPQIWNVLYQKKISSVMVEGGAQTLDSLIQLGLWDEAHVYTSSKQMTSGIHAPAISGMLVQESLLSNTQLKIFKNI